MPHPQIYFCLLFRHACYVILCYAFQSTNIVYKPIFPVNSRRPTFRIAEHEHFVWGSTSDTGSGPTTITHGCNRQCKNIILNYPAWFWLQSNIINTLISKSPLDHKTFSLSKLLNPQISCWHIFRQNILTAPLSLVHCLLKQKTEMVKRNHFDVVANLDRRTQLSQTKLLSPTQTNGSFPLDILFTIFRIVWGVVSIEIPRWHKN